METRGLFVRGGGAYLIQNRRWYQTISSYNELEYKVENLKYKKVGGHATKDQNEIRTSSR